MSEGSRAGADGAVAGTGTVRKRASEACAFCRRRKVRCPHARFKLRELTLADKMQHRTAFMCKLQDSWDDMQL